MDPIDLISCGDGISVKRTNGQLQPAKVKIINKFENLVTVYFVNSNGVPCTKKLTIEEFMMQNSTFYILKQRMMERCYKEMETAMSDTVPMTQIEIFKL